MKKNKIICLVVCMTLLLEALPVPSAATETQQPTDASTVVEETTNSDMNSVSVLNGSHTIDAQAPLCGSDKLLQTAGSAILYEINSDSLVYAWNPDLPVYPASLVKIMTALVAIENGNLAQVVTVSANAMSSIEKKFATLELKVGEELTLEQLIRCMLVGSANDASVVIADHIAGSQQGFAAMMNQRAAEIGCTGTVFTNPHGLHDNKQISTARDMVKILKEAIKNEDFVSFFTDTVYTLPATNMSKSRYMETTNYMMTRDVTEEYYDSRVTGGRTGVTDERRRCLIVTAEKGPLSFIAIVMDAIPKADPDDPTTIKRFGNYEEVGDLLDMGFRDYRVTQVLSDNEIIGQYEVENGTNAVAVGPSLSLSAVLPKDATVNDLTVKYEKNITTLTAPVEAGTVVNVVQLWYGDVCLAQSPLVTKNSSRVIDLSQSGNDADSKDDGFGKRLLIVLGVLIVGALAFAGVLSIIRVIRRMSTRIQHRRRRKYRRRSR